MNAAVLHPEPLQQPQPTRQAEATRVWRILAVDDEPLNLEIISCYLDDPIFHVELANNGEEAWECLNRPGEHWHLVLLDRMMPGMDGLEVLARMKQTEGLKAIPVIMQTAASAPEQVREGIEAGVYYYLTKPFDGDALVAIVRAALIDTENRAEAARRVGTHQGALALARPVEFQFVSVDEANRLAGMLAGFCPEPGTAVLGLTELLVNAVEHGNLGITYTEKSRLKFDGTWEEEVAQRLTDPRYRHRQARIQVEPLDNGGIRFTITDEGDGFDWQRYMDFDPERAFDPNGRGIAMASRMSFSSLEYRGKGNIAVATVKGAD